MDTSLLLAFLGWASLCNIGLLLLWFVAIVGAGNHIYRLHSGLFELSRADFFRFHYSAFAAYKMATLFFNLVPYLVLRFMV